MLRSTRIRAAVTAAALLVPPIYSVAAAPSASTLPDILLSRQLAEQASLRVGDTVTFAAEADGKDPKQFRVAGIYEPTPDPMRFTSRRIEARVHLPDLLAMTARPDDPSSADSVRAMTEAATKKRHDLVARLKAQRLEAEGAAAPAAVEPVEPAPRPKRVRKAKPA